MKKRHHKRDNSLVADRRIWAGKDKAAKMNLFLRNSGVHESRFKRAQERERERIIGLWGRIKLFIKRIFNKYARA